MPVSQNRLLATAAADGYAVEGSIFVAGAAVQWLRDKLGLLATSAESEALARSVPDTGGVYVVPHSSAGFPALESRRPRIDHGLDLGTRREPIWFERRSKRLPTKHASWSTPCKPTAAHDWRNSA